MSEIKIDQRKFRQNMDKALEGIAFDVQEALKDKLDFGQVDPTGKTARRNRGRWRSHLQASIQAKVRENSIEISMLDYAKHLEYGLPHKVEDFESLKEWVRDKIFKGSSKVSDKRLISVAKKVKKHIETRGMVPFPFIRHTFHTEVMDIIKKNLAEAFT